MALLFDKSAKSIAREIRNFLDKKDLIQSTKNFLFQPFNVEEKNENFFDV